MQYRSQRTSYESLEERVWGEAAKTRKGRVVCGEIFMMFHYDSYIAPPHEAVPRWEWPLTEEPGRTAMRKDMALVDYSLAGDGGSVGNGKGVIFFVPPPTSIRSCCVRGRDTRKPVDRKPQVTRQLALHSEPSPLSNRRGRQ